MALGTTYSTDFQAISDFLTQVDFQFTNPRSNRQQQTISFDVTITNTSETALELPLILLLDPAQGFTGLPLNNNGQNAEGAYLIDLSDRLPSGRLEKDESITSRTVTVFNPDAQRIELAPGIFTLPLPNQNPTFISEPVTEAVAGEPYTYQALATDPDSIKLSYLLIDSPNNMSVDGETGLVTWTPTPENSRQTTVTLQVYDTQGGLSTQTFTIEVEGGNLAPIIKPLPSEIRAREGEFLEIALEINDPDNNPLALWVDNLPPGAIFDPENQLLRWSLDFDSASTYNNVSFFARH